MGRKIRRNISEQEFWNLREQAIQIEYRKRTVGLRRSLCADLRMSDAHLDSIRFCLAREGAGQIRATIERTALAYGQDPIEVLARIEQLHQQEELAKELVNQAMLRGLDGPGQG